MLKPKYGNILEAVIVQIGTVSESNNEKLNSIEVVTKNGKRYWLEISNIQEMK